MSFSITSALWFFPALHEGQRSITERSKHQDHIRYFQHIQHNLSQKVLQISTLPAYDFFLLPKDAQELKGQDTRSHPGIYKITQGVYIFCEGKVSQLCTSPNTLLVYMALLNIVFYTYVI